MGYTLIMKVTVNDPKIYAGNKYLSFLHANVLINAHAE